MVDIVIAYIVMKLKGIVHFLSACRVIILKAYMVVAYAVMVDMGMVDMTYIVMAHIFMALQGLVHFLNACRVIILNAYIVEGYMFMVDMRVAYIGLYSCNAIIVT